MGLKTKTKSHAKSQGGAAASKMAKTLARHFAETLLPGDLPFTDNDALEAAQFALQAAANRSPNRSSITLDTVTGERRKMRIAIVNDDMPFLVDSTSAALSEMGLTIDRLVHPIISVKRNKAGDLTGMGSGKDAVGESVIYIETSRVDAKQRREVLAALRATMADVRAAVTDWPKIQKAMLTDADALDADGSDREGAELLRWLNNGMLTQLGHVTRQRDGSTVKPLGICKKSASELLSKESYTRAIEWFEKGPGKSKSQVLVIKANLSALVHRRVPLDLFIVPVRQRGKVAALSVHAGVWTSAALAAPPREIPRLGAQMTRIMKRLDFDAGSHAGKALVHALTALPHDLLIGFPEKDVERIATTMMGLVDRPRPRLALVQAPLARHLFAFVWLPRDMLATQIRLQIQALLEESAAGTMLDWSLEVEGGNLATLRFVLDVREGDPSPDEAAIDIKLQTMLRGWEEAVEAELTGIDGSGRSAALAARWADAFPQAYRSRDGAREAALDIGRLHMLGHHSDDGPGPMGTALRDTRLYLTERDGKAQLGLKLYQVEGNLPLSDAVPTLENFGFHVQSEVPTVLGNGELGTIHDFSLELGATLDAEALIERAPDIESAITAVLNGDAENDVFNRLVTEASLGAQEASWLRAFYRYLRQTGTSFTIYTVVDALSGAPDVTRALIALFSTQHDPNFGGTSAKAREAAAEEQRAAIKRGLARVKAINDDRILRLCQSLIEAILRTNAFAPAAREALAFKLDSSLVPGLPKPVPWREIFVYSRRVEGIHLRTGAIARGGLRWSDRRDDYRTEILGLMKAQRVKNAVIVPTGAKGGFYPKQLPNPALDRDGWAAEGQASYEVFIRTLLSVTDNIINDTVVHPDQVVIHDGEDPYFVVAADKGTARFSDVANGIAEAKNFWLDDAFASGGSNGYDHKAMGITARGAWLSVQRHFLEQGIDVQTDPVEVVGCGDMSGDVFGNGMLLSKAIKLVAAFDHRHIFIDPTPDPAASWKERNRMFALPRSSWEDYNPKLISKGGGVYRRDSKSITLSKAAQNALGIDEKTIGPDALISAILKAPADLIWFGGIGTYIKAERETHAQVGDPANDSLRVDAGEVRAKVVGEGANLGATQAGRIEFALAGGRINTDFIDNSGGVDCSDNEVNIKIALAAARRAGKLSEKRRNALLEDMTEEVAELVLDDNRLQALALSIAEAGGARAMASHVHLIGTLEANGSLDRRTEGLGEDQALQRRAADGQGLTRPELAVLLSSTKLVMQDAIEESDLPTDSSLDAVLINAFPKPMQRTYKAQIEGHRLKREIKATKLANTIINRLGIIHPFELAEEEGVDLAQVAAAFVAADALFNLTDLWEMLEVEKIPESARIAMFDRVAAATGNLMSDVLRSTAGNVVPSELIATIGKPIDVLTKATTDLLSAEARQQSDILKASLIEAGAPPALAARVTHLFEMDGAVGLAILASETNLDARQLTGAFTAIGEEIGLDWAQSTAAMMNPSDVWERLLVDGLARDFQHMRLELVRRLSKRKGAAKDMRGMVSKWVSQNEASVKQFRSMIRRAQTQPIVAPAMLAQIASMARNLLIR